MTNPAEKIRQVVTPWNTPLEYDSKTRALHEMQKRAVREIQQDHILVQLREQAFRFLANQTVPGVTKTPFDEMIKDRIEYLVSTVKEARTSLTTTL